MRFAVDAHAIGRNLTGNEVYVRSLLRGFAELDRESDFYAYVSEPGAKRWIPERFHVRHVPSNPYLRLGWSISKHLRADKPDLLHVQYTAPLFPSVPTVVTVHDVSFIDHPEYFTATRRPQLRLTVARSVARAAKIITVSEFSRHAILRAYNIPGGKVHAIPNAASPDFRPVGWEKARTEAREILNFDAPFIFTVGDLQPRKNQIGLIAAFSKLLTANPSLKHHLVLTGKQTWFTPRVHEAARASGFADRIHFTGFIPDTQLLNLYNACDCFVFPSFYEGFGLPILEAMACGRAVICSNTSAMPEVADGAGILFDPRSIEDITRAIRDVLLDNDLRSRMERLGLQRAAGFSWQRAARATLDVYREVAEATSPTPRAAATVAAGRSQR